MTCLCRNRTGMVFYMKDENIIEKPVREERVFEGRLVKVNRMDVTLPNGKPALREIVRHPGASAIVPVDEQGYVTMVRQYRAPLGKVILEIPAGKLDGKGEDRLLAARRELQEETGLSAGKWTHLTDIATTPGFCDEVISIYLATELSAGETHPDEDEFLNVVRLPLKELVHMVMGGEICDAKTLTGILMADRALEGEHGV